MKNHGITVIARLFGISTEAIRKYEKYGIIASSRDKQNNYRKYTTWDIVQLFRARLYAKCGFSLKSIAKILSTPDIDEVEEIIKSKEENLVRETLLIQNQLKVLQNIKQGLSEVERSSKASTELRYHYEQRPAIYFCEFMGEQSLNEDEDILYQANQWMECLPFVFLGIRTNYQKIVSGDSMFTGGICVTEEDKEKYKLRELPDSQRFESTMCLTAMLVGSFNHPLDKTSFERINELIKSKRFFISGEIIGEIKYSVKIDDEYKFYHKVWIPIDSVPDTRGKMEGRPEI